MKGDNQGWIALAHNQIFHAQTKHTNIQHYYIRDEFAAGRINLSYIAMAEMIFNGLTKPLTYAKFYNFMKQMRIN